MMWLGQQKFFFEQGVFIKTLYVLGILLTASSLFWHRYSGIFNTETTVLFRCSKYAVSWGTIEVGHGYNNAYGAGETVRRSLCLDALRLEGGTRLGEVLPVILGLADNTSIQLLDLGSQRLILEDGPTQLVCQSLAKNSSLRLLSLEGWTFRIEVSLLAVCWWRYDSC
jgi:hypothetical protein